MIRSKILNIAGLFIFLFLISNQKISAQKIDSDSLLTVIIKDMQNEKNYEKNIQRALIGKKIAPAYLDYYLVLGRNYDFLKNTDSARYYYKYYIEKNVANEDAFNYLINLELEDKKYKEAEIIIDQAIALHSENKGFEQKKIVLFQLQKDRKKEYEYLKNLQLKNPNDNAITQLVFQLESKLKTDRIGVNYSLTSFDRKGYGPWQLGSLQYIRERQWGSLIGRINYADRISFGQNFKNGWEGDLGIRYLKIQDGTEFKTAVVGVGKYLDSFWVNLRTFIQKENDEYYPAVTLTIRYYFDTRFDYIALTSGYGSSPEERTTLSQFKERISLNSYRMGAGYFKLFNNHYITGIQLTYNKQEYIRNATQNELELSLMLQYKF